jgi:hypothetical protein
MVTRLTNLVPCLVLIAMDAAGIERRTCEVVKFRSGFRLRMGVRPMTSRPDDFVLGDDDSDCQFIIPHT